MSTKRLLAAAALPFAVLLLLVGCSSSDAVTTKPAATSQPSPSVEEPGTTTVSADEITRLVTLYGPLLDTYVQEANDCKAYATSDLVGIIGDDTGSLRATADLCWESIDNYVLAATALGDALGPYAEDASAPAEIADLVEDTVFNAIALPFFVLTPECKNGSEPDEESCTNAWGTVFSSFSSWADDLSPRWADATG